MHLDMLILLKSNSVSLEVILNEMHNDMGRKRMKKIVFSL